MSTLWAGVRQTLISLPAWLFLIAGLGMLGSAVLVPPYLECRQLAWQLELLRSQQQWLDEQRLAAAAVHASIQQGDPLILQRLGHTYLGLRPAQSEVWVEATSDGRGAVESWFYRPPPAARPYQPLHSTLITLSHGPARVVVLAMGMALIAAAVWPVRRVRG